VIQIPGRTHADFPSTLGEAVDVETLRLWLAEGNTLTVEVQTLDQGLHAVRLLLPQASVACCCRWG